MSSDHGDIHLPRLNSFKRSASRNQRAYRLIITLICCYIVIYRLPWHRSSALPHYILQRTGRVFAQSLPIRYRDDFHHVELNRTLGFEKIIVLSLPERHNKHDELTMMADASGLDLDFQDAVHGEKLVHKGLPAHDAALKDQEIGCWRSHVNVWQRIIRENIQSALVLEDDVDWHQDVKKQFEKIQAPLASLSASIREDMVVHRATKSNPYPGDWELLWVGHCLEEAWANVRDKVQNDGTKTRGNEPLLLYQDDTVPSSDKWGERYRSMFQDYGIPLTTNDNTTETQKSLFNDEIIPPGPHRVLQKARFPVCTAGYAITLKGARKMLYYATRSITRPIDHSLAQLGYDDHIDSYSIIPALMGQWKIDHGWNSDITSTDDNATTGLEVSPSIGSSENVGEGSIRKQIKSLYFGKDDVFRKR